MAKTCIYYELDQVSVDDVRRARASAGADCVEVVPRGAIWPAEAVGRSPQRAENHRDSEFLNTVMSWVSRLGSALEQQARDVSWRRGVSMAEATRFDLLFSVAEAVQRWSVLSTIRKQWNPDRLIWYTARPWPDRDLAALQRGAGAMRVEVHRAASLSQALWKSARESLKLRLGPPVKRAGYIAQSLVGRRQSPHDRREVVITEYFPNNIHALLPVARHLESDHGIRVRWLAARQKVVDALSAHGVESLLLPELVSPATHWRGRLSASQRRTVKRALRELPGETLSWDGAAASREYFLGVLERRLVAAWDQIAQWIEYYADAWEALRPAVVLSATYSNGMGRAAAATARVQGARAAYLEHGIFPAFPVFAWFCHDLLMMWGEWNLRSLVRFGVDEQLICVTGPTIYDAMLRQMSQVPPRPLPRPGEPFHVAYMPSRTAGTVVTYAEARATMRTVARAVRRLPGGRLTVKIHPGDHTGMIPEVLREFPEFSAVQSGSSRDVILNSDAVIVVSSTTGFEACAADKPLILLNLTDSRVTVPYVEYGAALEVSAQSEDDAIALLEQSLSSLQQDPAVAAGLARGRQLLLKELLGGGQGNAAETAAAAIARLLGRDAGHGLSAPSEPLASRSNP